MCAEIDPLLMIRPPRGSCAFIVATASRAHRKAPVRLTATVDNHPSIGISSTPPTGPNVPALLTSRSTRPHSPRAAANRSVTDAGSATSVGTTSAASVPSAVSSSVAARRPASATLHPASSNARATTRPIPDPAPVTTATLRVTGPHRSGRDTPLSGVSPDRADLIQ